MARAGDHTSLSVEVLERLRSTGMTVAVVESAAGGLIAAELSRLPGSSVYFRGGVVAYDAASKTGLLGIPAGIFEEHGSVSAEAAQAMAEAARRLFNTDLGVGETSIAGPGGATPAKPAGLSYVAVANAISTQVRESTYNGDRDENRQAAVRAALQLLAAAIR